MLTTSHTATYNQRKFRIPLLTVTNTQNGIDSFNVQPEAIHHNLWFGYCLKGRMKRKYRWIEYARRRTRTNHGWSFDYQTDNQYLCTVYNVHPHWDYSRHPIFYAVSFYIILLCWHNVGKSHCSMIRQYVPAIFDVSTRQAILLVSIHLNRSRTVKSDHF